MGNGLLPNGPSYRAHPRLYLNCRVGGADQCPKLGVERTQRGHAATAESDPEPDIGRIEIPQRSSLY
jgi:hypothetical protein